MGLFRKLTSMSTGGLVDFRSDKERTARNTKKIAKEAKRQTDILASPRQEAPRREAPRQDDRVTQLERLAELRDKGVLNVEEFEAEKRRILES
jgi:putative oligomerization/nucleic acid binding protein